MPFETTNNQNYQVLLNNNIKTKKDLYYSNTHIQKENIYGCMCCFFWIIGFMLCFLLIPHQPTVVLHKLECYTNSECIGYFKFTNNNFYKTYWTNPTISLYWEPYKNQPIGKNCYNNDTYCDNFFNYDTCAIKIGQFESIPKFKVNTKSSKIKKLMLTNMTSHELACISCMLLNPYETLPQILLIYGNVNVKSNLNYIKNMKINDYYYFN
jgi:hypothetical protein